MNRFAIAACSALTVAAGAFLIAGHSQQNAVAAASSGTITGRVVLTGDAPAAKKIKVTKDNEKCGAEVTGEELVVGPDKGIENAVVSVTGLKGAPPKPTAAATVDQRGCVFRPHVAIVGVGAPLEILNNDGILHNFHTHGSKNSPMNRAQPAFRKKMTETFNQPETMKVTCDAHPWMSAWVVVTDHPYIDASDNGGNFKIADVPPGNHTIEVWHETLGKITKTVALKAGEETKINIEMSRK